MRRYHLSTPIAVMALLFVVSVAAVSRGNESLIVSSQIANADQQVRTVNLETISVLAGLDSETLSLIGANSSQQAVIKERLVHFMARSRPKLLTYRAIWAEMRERHNNLSASAAQNAFDPCEFVTDEAVQAAAHHMRDARRNFESFCVTANEGLENVFDASQLLIITNAAMNAEFPSPYRWLSLQDTEREALRRLIEVHKARSRLAKKYPQLQERLKNNPFKDQVVNLLNDSQRQELAALESLLSVRLEPVGEKVSR